ncbi:universal stress protein [uncultured Brevundimonas sp.]|uniref:universal stress protein n=1 Tax=uncultured Brevundimonas sp. TaxID=213418 RepID=UPI0030EF251F|tara:strand:+ start:84416 stop:85279 length:864 start_codon:yes stop_codon:yes gene_type:complete
MSYKLIMALAGGGPGDDQTLAFAAGLAARHGAVARVLPIHHDATIDLVALGMTLGAPLSPEAIEALSESERDCQHRIETGARSAARTADIVYGDGDGAPRILVHPHAVRPSLALVRTMALADLVVIGQTYLQGAGYGTEVLGQILLQQRSPVLIARGGPERLAGQAAIAWDGSAEAGRAVRSALPLIAMASGLMLLQYPEGLDDPATAPETASLNAYLRLHGVGTGRPVAVAGRSAGEALVEGAQDEGVDLLVAGAWGHSRLREAIFGGATRAFLEDTDGPCLLLAH